MDTEEAPLKQIRTFQGDVAEVLQKQKGSLVSIQQTEHLKKRSFQSATDTPADGSGRKTGFFFLLLGSLALFILGAIGTWYAYNEFVRRATTPLTAAPANRFISADTEINLNLTTTSRETLIETLAGALKDTAPGKLKHIVLIKKGAGETTELAPISEFLKILESRAPSSLVRAFNPLFMFGVFGNSTFFVIKLASFENAFAGMLAWEKDMDQDLGPLLATAPLSKELSPGSTFTDLTDRNKDVRMLAFGNQPILLYSFFDNNMLIITDNIETLRTLIDRLTQTKLSR